MHAIAETVRRFMKEPSDNPKFILSLGCGLQVVDKGVGCGNIAKQPVRSDPLPFMLLSSDRSLCRNTVFVDIDYEKLMINKKLVVKNTKEITDLLDNVEVLPDEDAIQLRSDQYLAIGCDLKDL